MKANFLLFCLCFAHFGVFAQYYSYQHFDGADTLPQQSLIIKVDSSNEDIWQIGKPSKTIFNAAYTSPNVIITDTLNSYPPSKVGSFQFEYVPPFNFGIIALQWTQKLDFDKGIDGGIVEFSTDSGNTWQNAFTSPLVYNFYGFDPNNRDTLLNGKVGFTGTDTNWRDIWLCFNSSWASQFSSIWFQFTLVSDSVDTHKEGWVIDNLMARPTIIHTAVTPQQKEYLKIYPNPTKDILYIELQKRAEFHLIEKMELMNMQGEIVEKWEKLPTKFFIETKKYAAGVYRLRVQTNVKTETVSVIIDK